MLGLGNILTKGGALLGFPNKYSFNFDGSNDYLEFGEISLTDFSISAWIYMDDLTTQTILGDGNNNNWVRIDGADSIKLKAGGTSTTFSPSLTFTTGEWQHICITRESNLTKVYRNGTVGTGTVNNTGTFAPDRVGAKIGNSSFFDGLIDEVAIWDTALDASIIAKIGSKVVDLTKYSASNLKLWLRAGDKVLPESDASIARSDFYTDFDGTDDYIDCGDDTILDITGALTLGAWIKTSNTADFQGIIARDDGVERNYGLQVEPTSGLAKGIIFGDLNDNITSTTIVADGVWHHVVFTFIPSTSLNIYVDGVLEATTTSGIPSYIDNDDVSLKIGTKTPSDFFFNGQISSASVYQTALDAQTISQMAKSRFTPMRDNRFSVVDFDGSDDKITFTRQTFTGAFSIIFWFNGDVNTHYQSLFNDSTGANNNILIKDSNGFVTIRINGNYKAIISGVPHNEWCHLAFTRDGSGNIKSYLNGVAKGTSSTTDEFALDMIGDGCVMSMASASMYNVEKSAEEVYAIYQQGITYDESSLSGLVGYWRMGSDTSKAYPTIADSSSNSNDGTMTSMASDDIVQQMISGYDMGAFESSSEELGANTFISLNNFSPKVADRESVSVSGDELTLTIPTASDAGMETGNLANLGLSTALGYAVNDLAKLQFEAKIVTNGSGINTLRIADSQQYIFDNSNNITLTSTYQTFTIYGKITNLGYSIPYFLRMGSRTGTDIYKFKNFSVQKVLQSADLSDTFPALIDVNEPVLGVDQVTNGTFDSDSNWTKGTGWSINTSTKKAVCDGTQTGNTELIQQDGISGASLDFVVGKTYKLTFDVTTIAGTITYIEIGGAYDHTDVPSNDTLVVRYLTATSTNDRLSIAGNSTFEGTVDNVVVKEVFGNVGTMTNQDSADLVYSSVLPDQSFLTGVNSAYNFIDLDGSDQSINCGGDIDVVGAFAISAWINPDNFEYQLRSIASQGNSFFGFGDHASRKLLFQGQGSSANNLKSNTDLAHSTWHHIILTVSGTNAGDGAIYVNGTRDDDGESTVFLTAGDFVIGRMPNASSRYMKGKIGQVAVFNKALSSTDASAIHTLGRHGNLLDKYSDNLVGYWGMSALDASTGLSDSISTIYDRSGNSNHGIPDNADAGDLASSPNAEPNGYAKGDTNRSTTTP